MTYNTFLSIIEKTGRVKICDAIGVLDDLYRQAVLSEEALDEYYRIYDLIDLIFQQKIFIGDGDDYHNIAVVCAKQDDFDAACRFLEQGLRYYPYNVDLLADYLKYGMKCSKFEQCEFVYKNLMEKKSNWNWRAYRFTIDYLMDLASLDLIDRSNDIVSLIKRFQEYLPDEEDAYLVEAEYVQNGLDRNESIHDFVSILQYAVSEESPVKRTPKCDLKLADFYYNNGTNIESALELLERCKRDSIEVQSSVNRNYVYLLSALCKMTQYYDMKENISQENKEQLIQSVYQNYHIAALDMSDSRVRDCKYLIESFVRETKIPYPYDDAVDNMIY